MEFSQIPSNRLSEVWGALLPYIERALQYSDDESEPEDLYVSIALGDMQLWAVHEGTDTKAVGVTMLVDFPNYRICRIVLFAGNGLKDMLPLLPKFEQWAISQGCAKIDWQGRKGFERIMQRYGYEPTYVVMRKHLIIETLH